jgi:hypothetical protein
MDNPTKYDNLIKFFLDNWLIAILVILAVLIGFIPNLRDGIVQLMQWMKIARNKEFKVISRGETITFNIKTSSALFDIVKVNALTHDLGVNSEYRWIEKYYPDYKIIMQGLQKIPVDNEQYYYDVITIKNIEGRKKKIYFDITSFLNKHGSTLSNKNKFIESKIKELHKNKEKKNKKNKQKNS